MEVILIEGVEYLKANVAAKRFKYTSDYIGQLCRGKKIDAKLVGRTWYVNPLSLTTHKKDKLIKNAENSESKIAIKIKTDEGISRIDVQSVPRKATAKILATGSHSSHFAKHIDWQPIKYKEDNTDLLPNLGSVNNLSTRLKVDIAGAEKLSVKETTRETKMSAEPLPEVSMGGSLKVRSLDDRFVEEDDKTPKNIAIPEYEAPSNGVDKITHGRFSGDSAGEVVAIRKSKSRLSLADLPPKEITEKQALYDVEIHRISPTVSFVPKVIAERDQMSRESEEIVETTKRFSGVKFLLLSTLATTLLLAVIFCLEFRINSTDHENNWKIIFAPPSLKL